MRINSADVHDNSSSLGTNSADSELRFKLAAQQLSGRTHQSYSDGAVEREPGAVEGDVGARVLHIAAHAVGEGERVYPTSAAGDLCVLGCRRPLAAPAAPGQLFASVVVCEGSLINIELASANQS